MPSSGKLLRLLMLGTMLSTGFSAAQVAISDQALADDDDDDRGRRGGSGEPNDDRRVYLDANVDVTAQELCPSPQLWQGDGNPPTTFQRKRNRDAGIELAIKGIIRGGPDIRSTYVDGDGLVHIEVPSGEGAANRAKWNFTYSYDVALDSDNKSLDHYDGELWVDLDASDKTKYLKLELDRVGPTTSPSCVALVKDLSGFGWKEDDTIRISDDEGDPTARVTQNSQNLGFGYYRDRIDGDPDTKGHQPYNFGPGEFDVVMILKEKSRHRGKGHNHGRGHDDDREATILHVVFNVVDMP